MLHMRIATDHLDILLTQAQIAVTISASSSHMSFGCSSMMIT